VVFNQAWKNSLGMDFVPLAFRLMAGAHEVSSADFAAYLHDHPERSHEFSADNLLRDEVKSLPISRVSKAEAADFAAWLTDRERALGLIDPEDSYRLPTDAEWSLMAGLTDESGASPFERSSALLPTKDAAAPYFWGSHWPPTDRTGNFADQSALEDCPSDRVITNYADGFAAKSPVGSFEANASGLFDLDGNVKEWVSDPYDVANSALPLKNNDVARGGNYLSFRPNQLRVKTRTPLAPNSKDDGVGFRLVLSRSAN
jgi:formylglycine-generating enzyme required for sulfatase activity